MKQFSKKDEAIFLWSSILLLALTSLLVLFSSDLLLPMQKFFVAFFRRKVNLSKWGPTIISLMSYPVFAVILFDAAIFIKFSDRAKNTLLFFALALCAFFTVYLAYVRGPQCMDSDCSAEMALAKECYMAKTLWPRTWHYSTEIRILQAELFAAPLFLLTQNFQAIKAVSALFSSLCVPLSLYFLLSVLKIKKKWIKLLCCLLVFAPASMDLWDMVQFGNYYAFHIALQFLYAALAFALFEDDFSKAKKKFFQISFFALSFVLGLTGMRYLVQCIGPVFFVCALKALSELLKDKKISAKNFFLEKKVFYSALGLLFSLAGFLANQIVLSRFYNFSFTGTFEFCNLGEIDFSFWLKGILRILGFRGVVSVLSPAGIVNVFSAAAVFLMALCFFDFLRSAPKSREHSTRIDFAAFSLFAFALNVFATSCFSGFNNHYLMAPFFGLVPLVAICQESRHIFLLKRYFCMFALCATIIPSSFITYAEVMAKTDNKDCIEAARFVQNAGYTLGFSRREPSTNITYFTNGKVEMGLVWYENRKFLTSSRFWDKNFKAQEKVFLIATKEDFLEYPALEKIENCQKIFENQGFAVFGFENKDALKAELQKEKYSEYMSP